MLLSIKSPPSPWPWFSKTQQNSCQHQAAAAAASRGRARVLRGRRLRSSHSQNQGPCELLGNALPRDLPHTSLQHLDQHNAGDHKAAGISGSTARVHCGVLHTALPWIHCAGMTPRAEQLRKSSPFHTPCPAELPDLGTVLSSLSNQ